MAAVDKETLLHTDPFRGVSAAARRLGFPGPYAAMACRPGQQTLINDNWHSGALVFAESCVQREIVQYRDRALAHPAAHDAQPVTEPARDA